MQVCVDSKQTNQNGRIQNKGLKYREYVRNILKKSFANPNYEWPIEDKNGGWYIEMDDATYIYRVNEIPAKLMYRSEVSFVSEVLTINRPDGSKSMEINIGGTGFERGKYAIKTIKYKGNVRVEINSDKNNQINSIEYFREGKKFRGIDFTDIGRAYSFYKDGALQSKVEYVWNKDKTILVPDKHVFTEQLMQSLEKPLKGHRVVIFCDQNGRPETVKIKNMGRFNFNPEIHGRLLALHQLKKDKPIHVK